MLLGKECLSKGWETGARLRRLACRSRTAGPRSNQVVAPEKATQRQRDDQEHGHRQRVLEYRCLMRFRLAAGKRACPGDVEIGRALEMDELRPGCRLDALKNAGIVGGGGNLAIKPGPAGELVAAVGSLRVFGDGDGRRAPEPDDDYANLLVGDLGENLLQVSPVPLEA